MTLQELEAEILRQREVQDGILRVLWHYRGVIKGISNNQNSVVGKIESELEPHFKEWLERSKNESS